MKYQQLTQEERYQIWALRKKGFSYAAIGRELGRHPTTISRELRRNESDGSERCGLYGYTPGFAHKKARQRRVDKGVRSRKIQGELKTIVEAKLELSWSPEQISGRLLLEQGIRISHETIYQHVLRDSKQKGHLRYCLRFSGYKHHRFKKSKHAEKTRLRKHWIAERPRAANERTERGHWERDTLLGERGGAAYLTLVDRRSRYVKIQHVENLESDVVAAATIRALRGVPCKTVTNDGGVEFGRDESLQRKLRVPIYFCDPSSPWQRGSVENMNGLIRQYVPKGTAIDKLHVSMATMVAETLNYRPRKTLGYRTPHEAFSDEKLMPLTSQPLLRLGLEFSRHT